MKRLLSALSVMNPPILPLMILVAYLCIIAVNEMTHTAQPWRDAPKKMSYKEWLKGAERYSVPIIVKQR